ncbi:MAG: ribonuclease HII [Pseudomonadota bacterium]
MDGFLVCGVDEVGRGPWAGPVCAGAVVLDRSDLIDGLADSKTLTEKSRERLSSVIQTRARAWGLGWASAEEIDRLNIRKATHLAMRRAVSTLFRGFDMILVDGADVPDGLPGPGRAIIGGDGSVAEISAASILAKVARDHRMAELDRHYPGYGFASHKGYGTKRHREALDALGPCAEHRKSFKPVANRLETLTADAG